MASTDVEISCRRSSNQWRGVVVTMVLIAACQRQVEQRQPTPLDLTTVGSIAGEIRVEGPVPESTVLNLASAAECKAQYAGQVSAGDVLVRDGRVGNVLVAIKKGLEDRVFAVPTEPVVIDQRGCLFVPRVAAGQVGQPVRFLNSDPLAHNVHASPQESRGWNFILGLKGTSRETTVSKAEPVIEIKCDIHPWMKAYLGVFDHPYFAVTGADGRFMLPNVPPGRYVVQAWHERFGTREVEVAVGEKEAKQVTLTFRTAAPH